MKNLKLILVSVVCLLITISTKAQIIAEAEGSVVIPGYNEIRIPGNAGTTFDAVKDLGNNIRWAYRVRGGYRLKNKHNLFVLYAPLKLTFKGDFAKSIEFYGKSFEAGQSSQVDYVFNSYRFTYRYDFIATDKVRIGAGATAKIRDAYIQLAQGDRSAKKKNVGVVPLINFMAYYKINKTFGLVLEGDGLGTGQGRAFDIQLSVPIKFDDFFGAKIGYRVLEGGANNDEVYNFSWTNYIQAGVFYNFY